MESTISVINVIFLLGAAQGVFLAVLLLNRQNNKKSNKYLAALLLVYSMFITESSIWGLKIAAQFPHLVGLFAGAIFLVGPLHYLYARSLTGNSVSLSKPLLFHLIPFAGFYLYYLFPFYLKSGEFKIEYIRRLAIEGQPLSLILFNWLTVLQGIVYMTIILVYLKRYAHRLKDLFSNIDRINLNWLKYITIMTLAVWTLGFLVKITELSGRQTPIDDLIPVSIALLVYTMGYLGFRQPELFSAVPEEKGGKKYERSGLTDERAQAILERLTRLMEEEKPYTDSTMKLSSLARMISVTPNHLSQVLNDTLQQNFFDYVNYYRVEEAKRMFTDSTQQHFTLLAIAYEVGFNSKSAFYTAFRKHTGMTPAQYRKEQPATS